MSVKATQEGDVIKVTGGSGFMTLTDRGGSVEISDRYRIGDTISTAKGNIAYEKRNTDGVVTEVGLKTK